MKLNKFKCAVVFIISFAAMLSALLSIPDLSDVNTCVRAAFTITLAYSWFGVVLWANLIHPLLMRDKKKCN